jgi:hypothetical protein
MQGTRMEYNLSGTWLLFPSSSLVPTKPTGWNTYSTTALHQTSVVVVPDSSRMRDRAYVFLGSQNPTQPGACDAATTCYSTLLGAVRFNINATSAQYALPPAGPNQTPENKYLFAIWLLPGILITSPSGKTFYVTGQSNTMNLYSISSDAEVPLSCGSSNICPASGGVVSKIASLAGYSNAFVARAAFAMNDSYILMMFSAAPFSATDFSGVRSSPIMLNSIIISN